MTVGAEISIVAQRHTAILVVDDDLDLRESMQEILEMEGYSVATAANGRLALELLRQGERPDLILLDLMMPVMNGAQFLGALRADADLKDLPVLLVTAFADRARDLPAEHVLEKPLDFPAFLALISAFTRGGSA